MTACPFCGEPMSEHATICPACHFDLREIVPEANGGIVQDVTSLFTNPGFWFVVCQGIVVIGLIYLNMVR